MPGEHPQAGVEPVGCHTEVYDSNMLGALPPEALGVAVPRPAREKKPRRPPDGLKDKLIQWALGEHTPMSISTAVTGQQ